MFLPHRTIGAPLKVLFADLELLRQPPSSIVSFEHQLTHHHRHRERGGKDNKTRYTWWGHVYVYPADIEQCRQFCEDNSTRYYTQYMHKCMHTTDALIHRHTRIHIGYIDTRRCVDRGTTKRTQKDDVSTVDRTKHRRERANCNAYTFLCCFAAYPSYISYTHTRRPKKQSWTTDTNIAHRDRKISSPGNS